MKKHLVPQKKNHLIAQSRSLVEAKYNFTLWEMRLFISVLEQIKKEDKELKRYRVYYKDLIKEYGENKKDYKYIRNASIRLLRKIAHFEYVNEEGQERVYHAVLFTGADTPKNWQERDEGMFIDFSVNGDLKEQLIQLKRNYLLYDKRHILRLKSKFSVRIYQLLKSHEREAKDTVIVEYKVKILREMLLVDEDGNPNNQYKDYYLFKKRVLLQAQKDLKEHTDISFSFDEIKKGRRIDIIRFFVKKNRKKSSKNKSKQLDLELQKPPVNAPKPQAKRPQKTTPKAPRPSPPTVPKATASDDLIQNNQAYKKLVDIGVVASTAYKLVESHNIHYILTSIQQAQQAHQTSTKTNFAGFVISCIKQGTYKQIQQKQQAKKTKAQAHQKRQDMHLQILHIKNAFEKERKQHINLFRKKLDKTTTLEVINIARKINNRSQEMTEKGLKDTVYFDFAIVTYFDKKGEFPKEYVSFENYMQKHHKVKISRENNEAWYEVVG